MKKEEKILLDICNIAIKAGNKVLEYYNFDNKIFYKKDETPITKADLDSNKIIQKSIKNLGLDIPILSEEEFIIWDVRKNWKKYWLIDPLDGTKEFIKKNGEFTINIALIENHQPILGVIYAPVLNKLFFSKKNYGSYKIITKNIIDNFKNAVKISVNNSKKEKVKIIGSRSHSNPTFDNWIKNKFNNFDIIHKGSSLKFCEIAEGNADIYPRFGPTSEWDIAAGHIILEEAGGKLKSIDNKDLLYNKKENILNPYFFAYANKSFLKTNESESS